MTAAAATLLRVRADDPDYRARAAAEAEFWSKPHPFGLETMEIVREPEGPTERHRNRRYTGHPRREWQETIGRHGTFRRGLVLGTSSLRIEGEILATNPSLHLTFLDISEGALARRAEVLGPRHPGRVATRVADLNFLELESDAYDLIVSSSSLHHVTNLEHLAFQINRALRPEGRFFLDDYVGEPRFQFAPEKKRVFEALYERDLGRQPGRRPGLVWLDASDLSPFCGLRSDETLPILRTFLREIDLRTAGTLLVPLMRTRPVHPPTPTARQLAVYWVRALWNRLRRLAPPRMAIGRHFIRELTLVGDVLSDAGLLVPGTAFATYGKQ